MRLKPIGLALIALSTGAPAVPTRACDSASCSLPTRGANVLVPKKQFRLDLSFGYSDQGLLLRGSQEVDTVYRPRVFLERETIIPGFHRDIDSHDRVEQANMAYGLSERVNLVASAPLAIWHAHTVAHGAVEQEYGTVGFGDALVGARFSLRPRGLVAGFSLKLPTGAHEIDGEFGGGIQDPTLQPGTGAFDFVGSLQYAWEAPLGLGCSAAATYQATSTNDLGYRFGNQAIATLGASHKVTTRLSASLQGKLYHQARNRYLGAGVPSTGGTFVYLTPGLHFSAPKRVSLYAFLLLVPYRYVNEAQLAPRAGVLTGISKTF